MEAVGYEDLVKTGPGTLAGRYLRQFWQPLARIEDLAPGQTRPIRLMSEDFTLYRGQSGEPHLVAFRCAHRGTQLSTGWVEGDNLRCFYHGWVYGPDGQCVEQPAEPEPFCQRIRIRSYPIHEYLGLIFGYLGDDEPPDLPRFPEFEDEGVLEVMPFYANACNYFQRIENHVDESHIAFVHRDSWYRDTIAAAPPQVSGEETEYGIRRFGVRPDGTPLRVASHMMPNILIRSDAMPAAPGLDRTRDAVQWAVPIDDEHFYAPMVYITRVTGEEAERYRARIATQGPRGNSGAIGEEVLRGEKTTADIEGNIGAQDYVSQVGQGRIADRSGDHLGHSDVLVAMLRNIWLRELSALAEGRPLKQWRRTGRRMELLTAAPA
jgi:5,5'-dehydrodivanillate O-demethylase oxygenase subunit